MDIKRKDAQTGLPSKQKKKNKKKTRGCLKSKSVLFAPKQPPLLFGSIQKAKEKVSFSGEEYVNLNLFTFPKCDYNWDRFFAFKTEQKENKFEVRAAFKQGQSNFLTQLKFTYQRSICVIQSEKKPPPPSKN